MPFVNMKQPMKKAIQNKKSKKSSLDEVFGIWKGKERKATNKTLTGLIIRSRSSGAIYFWNRSLQKAVCISDSIERPIGAITPIFRDSNLYWENGKLRVTLDLSNPDYDILQEIHNVDLTYRKPKRPFK